MHLFSKKTPDMLQQIKSIFLLPLANKDKKPALKEKSEIWLKKTIIAKLEPLERKQNDVEKKIISFFIP